MFKIFQTLISLFIGTCLIAPSWACTDIALKATDGTVMVARSMDFDIDLHSNLRSSPRSRAFHSITPNGKPGLSWQAKYGFVYFDGLNLNFAADGMNEKGLSIEALYLTDTKTYQTIPPNQEAHSLPYFHFADWVLSNFQNIDEVREGLKQVYVYTQYVPNLGEMVFPLHFAIHDATGKNIVVEFINGKMIIDDNKIGVVTNEPPYQWQITNLGNYANLSPIIPVPMQIDNQAIPVAGPGIGMQGLPGDASPVSRFVRAAILKKYAYPAKNSAEALNLLQHFMGHMDNAAGEIRESENGKPTTSITQWMVFKDLTNHILYYRTYQDTTLHAVKLDAINFNDSKNLFKMPLVDDQFVVDVTDKFKMTKG